MWHNVKRFRKRKYHAESLENGKRKKIFTREMYHGNEAIYIINHMGKEGEGKLK